MDIWQVLVLDPDTDSRRGLASYLGARGYAVAAVAGTDELWRRLARRSADIVIADLRVFAADPLAALRRLRGSTAAALIVAGLPADPLERILALEMGADEVLDLPLLPRELLARMRAFQRRALAARRGEEFDYRFAGWHFAPAQRRLTAPDMTVQRLTRGECAVLQALAAAPRRLVSRARLLGRLHPDPGAAAARSVDVVVARLRRKLGAARGLVTAERGAGYRLDCAVEQALAGSGPDAGP